MEVNIGSFTPSHVATSSHSFTILEFIKIIPPKFELELSRQEKSTKKTFYKTNMTYQNI
jgi:hypothetical protein